MCNTYYGISAESFAKVFISWIKEIVEKQTGKQIIIDGKAIRAAAEKSNMAEKKKEYKLNQTMSNG